MTAPSVPLRVIAPPVIFTTPFTSMCPVAVQLRAPPAMVNVATMLGYMPGTNTSKLLDPVIVIVPLSIFSELTASMPLPYEALIEREPFPDISTLPYAQMPLFSVYWPELPAVIVFVPLTTIFSVPSRSSNMGDAMLVFVFRWCSVNATPFSVSVLVDAT